MILKPKWHYARSEVCAHEQAKGLQQSRQEAHLGDGRAQSADDHNITHVRRTALVCGRVTRQTCARLHASPTCLSSSEQSLVVHTTTRHVAHSASM